MAPYSMDLRSRVLRDVDAALPTTAALSTLWPLGDPHHRRGLSVHGLGAPAVAAGPLGNPAFLAYVESLLVPTLQPGDVVILDNLAIHTQPAVQAAITAVGATLRFLPPYSPDFNPIEQAFAKLSAFLRAARPHTFVPVVDLVGTALTLFTPRACRYFIQHSGYRMTTGISKTL